MTETAFSALTQEEQIKALGLLGREALREFGVEPSALEPLVHAENTTFKVSSPQGIFNLRISRPGYQNTANIRSEIAWLNALRSAGFRVPEPYRGQIVTAAVDEVPQARDCALFRWMDGEFRREWSDADAVKVGRTMARLHAFVREWVPPADFDRQTQESWALGPREPTPFDCPHPMLSEEDRELLVRVDEESRVLIRRLPKTPDRHGLIHADMHSGNVLFDDAETNVIDFDDASHSFLYYDFASALAYQGDSEAYPMVRDALLRGYEEVLPLPPETCELLKPFLRLRLAGVCRWVLTRDDNPKMREAGHRLVAWMCGLIRRYR